ncbi:hypothetical protein HIM_06335 [Hirsutella minnesotensis 3608]|uniref:Response regulatory domain-containing protein n=1 Tax=Hirsutella minnesotensis 3608 TaxID=1043627 RepID=A0A0F8A4X3_9HYPO|nr:hypothetical protein HIM_06335 [Hirsutella minnesotensis 3608]
MPAVSELLPAQRRAPSATSSRSAATSESQQQQRPGTQHRDRLIPFALRRRRSSQPSHTGRAGAGDQGDSASWSAAVVAPPSGTPAAVEEALAVADAGGDDSPQPSSSGGAKAATAKSAPASPASSSSWPPPPPSPPACCTTCAIAFAFAITSAIVVVVLIRSIQTATATARQSAAPAPPHRRGVSPIRPHSQQNLALPPPQTHPLLGGPQLRSIHEHLSPAAAAKSTSSDSRRNDTSDPRHGHARDHDQLSVASSLAAAPSSPSAATASPGLAPVTVAVDLAESPSHQSLFDSRHVGLVKTLLHGSATNDDASSAGPRHSFDARMVTRKVWVKRPHASATTIAIHEDDLVDDVRDLILRKYANSLGRTFDSPDLTIRIFGRDQDKDRVLGPEEIMARTLDRYYPGGQTVDEALVVDIPRRTPKASPLAPPHHGATAYYVTDDARPSEACEGYFPPVMAVPSPHITHAVPVATNGTVTHSIAVLGTGHIPPIPSPGGGVRPRSHRGVAERPRLGRQHTSSPTILTAHPSGPPAANTSHSSQHFTPRVPHSRTHSTSSEHQQGLPAVKTPLAKSPGPVPEPTPARVATPPPRVASPRPSSARPKRPKKVPEYPATQTSNMLNGTVPPISVLIVEDNPINLKLLEAFVKRLKVRWQTAMNGRDAVKKWRTGGFHLVLMDIQLPVMNGLDATREIRRLERVNSIGVFTSTPTGMPDNADVSGEIRDQDRLENLGLFKSPVIIVALTASSLQSDRHEALAAGCNDFLTKPVNFVWLERKVMEWGCMQALIDFDGWRKWKDYGQLAEETEATKKAQAAANKAKSKRSRTSLNAA